MVVKHIGPGHQHNHPQLVFVAVGNLPMGTSTLTSKLASKVNSTDFIVATDQVKLPTV